MANVEGAIAVAEAQQRRIAAAIEAEKRRPVPQSEPKLEPAPPSRLDPPSDAGGKRALVLGNGPSLALHDLERIAELEAVTTYGVNRLPIVPDWYCALDKTVEDKWIPAIGECEGVVTTRKHRLSEREDAIVRKWVRAPNDVMAPPSAAGYFNGRVSGSFMVQWALENGERDIGLLGIEYSSKVLIRDQTAQTHWFGRHDAAVGSPTLGSKRQLGYRFWGALKDYCAREGIRLVNLVEYDTPFHEIGIPTMSMEDWLDG